MNKRKFSKNSDMELKKFYKRFHAETPSDKLIVLDRYFGGEACFSHEPTIEQKVAMLEYEWLFRNGVFDFIK